MKLNEVRELIRADKTKGIVKNIGTIINSKGLRVRYLIVEVLDWGLVTSYDDNTSNSIIDEDIELDSRVEVNIVDGMVKWSLMRGGNQNYFVPYCIDEKQITKKIIDVPEIRVYTIGSSYRSFTCFKQAHNFIKDCKQELELQTPVIAFDGLEIDIFDIRSDN